MRGFGFRLDVRRGFTRSWYMGADGVQRWMSDDQPVDPQKYDFPTSPRAATEQAIAEALKRMAPDDYKPMPDRPVPMESGDEQI